jgi:hypothetical protein
MGFNAENPELLMEHMRTKIKPVTVRYFQEKIYARNPELLEKNSKNIDQVVDALLHKYESEVGLYRMFSEKTEFTTESIRLDVIDIIFELDGLAWIEE